MSEESSSYDDLPYRSVPHADSHPTHLAVIGRLLGVPTPDPYRCRILELGCASGGSLVPIAWYLPGTECVGIERSGRQAEEGNRLIERVGLGNCRILAADILDVGPALGQFDYIVAHGVYSWVPDPVRARILDLCRELLAPNGVAFLSFNTLPGWRMRGALREMLLAHCAGLEQPAERLERARDLLRFLATAQGEATDAAARYLRQEVRYLLGAHPSYLYHEYLADTNEPLLFRDFAAQAAAHGLQYLADAELATMFPSTLGTAAEQALAPVDDQLALEQLIDFVRVRNFRRALLCHADVEVRREIALADVQALAFYGDLPELPAFELAQEQPEAFAVPGGATATVAHPLTKAALRLLAARFPDSEAFAELYAESSRRATEVGVGAPAQADGDLAVELFSLLASGVVRAEPSPRSWRTPAPERPSLNRLCRAQVAQGQIATPRHQALDLDPFAARLAELLDGTRDRAALVAAVREAAAGVGAGPAGLLRTPDAVVAANVERLLGLFHHHGVLEV